MKRSEQIERRYGLTSSKIEIPVESLTEKIHWFLIGDVHFGSSSCDVESLNNTRENIIKVAKKNKVVISLMGDIFDCILAGDKRYSATEEVNMNVAIAMFNDWCEPLLKTPNIYWNGALIGNHEMTLAKKGWNIFETINLMHPEITINGNATYNTIALKFKNEPARRLQSFLTHDCGKKSHKMFEDYAKARYNQAKTDTRNKGCSISTRTRIVAAGHTHELKFTETTVHVTNPDIKTEYDDKVYVCRTGSFTKAGFGTSNYAAEKGLISMPVGYIEIVFSIAPDEEEGENENIHCIARYGADVNKKHALRIHGDI